MKYIYPEKCSKKLTKSQIDQWREKGYLLVDNLWSMLLDGLDFTNGVLDDGTNLFTLDIKSFSIYPCTSKLSLPMNLCDIISAYIALVIKDTLFVHGAICTNSYGWIPGESNNKNNDNDGHTDDIDYNNKRIKDTDVNEWVNKLNAFASKGIYDCIHSDQDATPWSFTGGYKNHNTPCSNILQYGMGWLPNGKRNRTIVYNQWVIEDKNKLNSINFPTKEIINNLHLHGVKRILTGHKPLGDSPAIFSNNDRNFHVITADTSYSARTKYLNGMNEETLKIFDEFKKCDEQHAEHMNKSSDNIPKDISDIRHHGRRGYAVSEVIIDFDNNKKDSNNNDGVVFIHGTLANGDLFEANLNMEPLIGQQTNDGKFIQGIRLKDQKFIVSHSKGWNVF